VEPEFVDVATDESDGEIQDPLQSVQSQIHLKINEFELSRGFEGLICCLKASIDQKGINRVVGSMEK
jgi:hypothetical protein